MACCSSSLDSWAFVSFLPAVFAGDDDFVVRRVPDFAALRRVLMLQTLQEAGVSENNCWHLTKL